MCPANERWRYYCNIVSHWLGAYTKWSLDLMNYQMHKTGYQIFISIWNLTDTMASQIPQQSDNSIFIFHSFEILRDLSYCSSDKSSRNDGPLIQGINHLSWQLVANHETTCILITLGWGLLSQFPPFHFSALSNHRLPFEYDINIWQMSPQLTCNWH